MKRSSLGDDELVFAEVQAAVQFSPFKVPPATRTSEVALPSPIPFVIYQELEPVAVIFLLMKAAKPTLIPFVIYQVVDPVAVIFLLMEAATIDFLLVEAATIDFLLVEAATIDLKRHHRHRKDQLDHKPFS
jgi:hypothetical protein